MRRVGIITNEKGFTLMDVAAAAVIMAVAFAAFYLALVYAEKALVRDYHDRVATLLASGELDWQYYSLQYMNGPKRLDRFTSKPVVIDTYTSGGTLGGSMGFHQMTMDFHVVLGQTVYYLPVEIIVSWREPGDRETRKIALREDFY